MQLENLTLRAVMKVDLPDDNDNVQLTKDVCTRPWAAPEMCKLDGCYSEKADLFSLGLVFYHILTNFSFKTKKNCAYTWFDHMVHLVYLLGTPDDDNLKASFHGTKFEALLNANISCTFIDHVRNACQARHFTHEQQERVEQLLTSLLTWRPSERASAASALEKFSTTRHIFPASVQKFRKMPVFKTPYQFGVWIKLQIRNPRVLDEPGIVPFLYSCYSRDAEANKQGEAIMWKRGMKPGPPPFKKAEELEEGELVQQHKPSPALRQPPPKVRIADRQI